MSFDRVLEKELVEVLSSVETLVPKLRARRASVAAALARVDAALAQLTTLGGTPPPKRAVLAAPKRSRGGAKPPRSAPATRKRRARSSGGRTLSDLVVETLTAKGALGLSELARAVAAQRGAKVSGLPRLLWELKKRGLVQVEGTRGSFRYSAVRAG